MRLITWNCKGAFWKKHGFVSALDPDILVVPESEKLTGLTQDLGSKPVNSLLWFGSDAGKGLAVLSFGEYSVKVHPNYDERHKWIVPLEVSGPASFLLFAVWTLPNPTTDSYSQPLFEALESYQSLMEGRQTVWAGDFNSNYALDRPFRKYKFANFVAALATLGLHSVYHRHSGCDHGQELHDTFFLQHNAEKGHHIDYVFASERMLEREAMATIGIHAEWSKRSDHMPLICDFE